MSNLNNSPRNSMTCSADFHDPKSSNIQERNLQYYINFRKLRRSRGVVRLHSGDYAACGFEVLLRRKHEPLIYQVRTKYRLKTWFADLNIICFSLTTEILRHIYNTKYFHLFRHILKEYVFRSTFHVVCLSSCHG